MNGTGSNRRIEAAVGGFTILGLLALGYLSISLAGVELIPAHRYPVTARFAFIGDLKVGAPVKIAGVAIGRVGGIGLAEYTADVRLDIDRKVALPQDTIASIRSVGLLGESYVALSPGASERMLRAGGRIVQTEPALDLIELLGKYAFGSAGLEEKGGGGGEEKQGAPPPRAPLLRRRE